MRVSIWQQFGSNHSSNFTVIGTFPSALQAELAAREIRSIMLDVVVFWNGLSREERDSWWSVLWREMTPIEKTLSQLYEVEWCRNIDDELCGLNWMPGDPKFIPEIVLHLDKYVLIEKYDDKMEEYVNCEPFETLLVKWGAELKRDYEEHTQAIRVTVTCLAPDDATIESLVNDIRVSSPNDHLPPNHREVTINRRYYAILDMNIVRDDRKLAYAFHRMYGLGRGVPEFIAYLREHGCMDIEYTFEQA